MGNIAGHGRVEAESRAATDLANLCGHLPLALRIASARLAIRPKMTLGDLVLRLGNEEHRLEELEAGNVAIRASFRLSYGQLDQEAARLFRRLSLIPGPDFGSQVATLLVEHTGAASSLLESLVDSHLVEIASDTDRFRLHDLLRIFSTECMLSDDSEEDRSAVLPVY